LHGAGGDPGGSRWSVATNRRVMNFAL
jgi:hypothetical protein